MLQKIKNIFGCISNHVELDIIHPHNKGKNVYVEYSGTVFIYLILVFIYAFINIGCATAKSPESPEYWVPSGVYLISSTPEGAHFTIYTSRGQPIETPIYTDYTIYDNQGNHIKFKIGEGRSLSTASYNHGGYLVRDTYVYISIGKGDDVMIYPSYTFAYDSHGQASYFGPPSSSSSSDFRYQKFPIQLYNNINNPPLNIDISKNRDNITPRSVLHNNSYSYVTFELTGYPTQSINLSSSNYIHIDFTQLKYKTPSQGVETVISDAITQVIPRVPMNSTIAVLPVSTTDAILRDFITGESEYLLVSQGFRVVDRSQLEIIRSEQRFQGSGEIDNQTAVDIGRISGSDYMIMGQIDSESRLRLRILEVKTAEVVGVSSVSFGESQPSTTTTIEEAIRIALQQATKNVSRVARLAIVDVTADESRKDYITGESEYQLITQAFKVVDRSQLDRVRDELRIQHSGEVDTHTVAEIGKLAGADYLITIRADGQGGLARLRWRVLDTQSAVVTGVASVPYFNNISNASVMNLEMAVTTGIEQVTSKVGKDNRMAVVQMTGEDNNMRDFVQNNLEDKLVNQGFRLVNRSELDRIRTEQKYQQTNEVDNRTAVDIGKIAGARYILTGRVDGSDSLRRLRLRLLDTQTAEVVGVASVRV